MYVSYSAVDQYVNCPFSYKLKYIDKLYEWHGSVHTCFGNAIHKTNQLKLLDEKVISSQIFNSEFKKELKQLPLKIKQKIFIDDPDLKKLAHEMYKVGPELCDKSIKQLHIDFPGFKVISAEQKIIEPIISIDDKNYEFKGLIDVIIQTPDGRYKIIDWKTTSWGWKPDKKTDKMITYQLTYYKHYFCLQNNIDIDQVDTYFALIKRTAKDENIEIFTVPVGQKKINNALKVLNNVVYNIDNKKFIKNRLSCKFCDFHETIHCP